VKYCPPPIRRLDMAAAPPSAAAVDGGRDSVSMCLGARRGTRTRRDRSGARRVGQVRPMCVRDQAVATRRRRRPAARSSREITPPRTARRLFSPHLNPPSAPPAGKMEPSRGAFWMGLRGKSGSMRRRAGDDAAAMDVRTTENADAKPNNLHGYVSI
jgi:hypothetical protein